MAIFLAQTPDKNRNQDNDEGDDGGQTRFEGKIKLCEKFFQFPRGRV